MLNPDSKILQKIKKLLALAKGNANAHERERAMEAAHKLLKEHNLEMSTVEAVGNEVQGGVFDKIKIEPWVEAVFTAAGILYFTSVIKQGRRNKHGRYVYHPFIVGRPENIAVTCEMAAFFCHSIKAEAKRVFRDAQSIRSFKVGAGMMLLCRAKQVREAERRKAKEAANREAMRSFFNQEPTSTALACIHDKRENENEAFLKDKGVAEARRSRLGKTDAFASQVGAAYAMNLSLAPIAQKRLESKEDSYVD